MVAVILCYLMPEHRKHVQAEDSWICTNVYFGDILNLKR
jgi:hypothetical protein